MAAAVAAVLLIGLLPTTVLAAGPTATDDHDSVPKNAPATTVDVLANDTAAVTIVSATDPAHGTVVVAGDSLSLTYEPDTSYHGTDTFDYTITDGSDTDDGTVTIDVNTPPVAVDDPSSTCAPSTFGGSYPVPEDLKIDNGSGVPDDYAFLLGICKLTQNDTDADGDTLTYEIVTPPAHGDLISNIPLDSQGLFGYKPDPNYSTKPGDVGGGTWVSDSFTYRVWDGFAWSNTATMHYWVAPVNDPPTFDPGPALVSVGEDSGAYSAAWATNVSPGPGASEAGQTVHFVVDTPPNGVPNLFAVAPAIDATGHLTFTPNPDEVGLVHVTAHAVDDAGGDPDFRFPPTPAPNDTSADVQFDIVVMPDATSAVNDTITILEDALPSPTFIDALANDGPPAATVIAVGTGTLGDVTIAAGGSGIDYAPHANAHGVDTFSYTIDDGAGATDSAFVQVTITSVDDDPVAFDDSLTVAQDAPPTAVDVLGNDTDIESDTLTVTAKTDGAKGTVAITGGGTGVSYTPGAGQIGADTFTYTVGDGHGGADTASVTVTINNDVNPVAGVDSLTLLEDDPATGVDVLANDTDAESDPLTIIAATDGAKGVVTITSPTTLTYTPNLDANGTDSFTYTVSDGHGGSDIGTVGVTITPEPDDPVAVTDTPTVAEDAAATPIAVLGNDSDPDGDPVTITDKTNGTKGLVVLTSATTLTYKPNANAYGSDSFTYTISDGNGHTAIGTVNVTITPVNDTPNAVNDAGLTVKESAGATALTVLSNDSDIDGDSLTIIGKSNGAHGVVAITGGGTGLTYDPTQLYSGTDLFTYTVSDGHGKTDSATVLLTVVKDTVKPVTVAPVQTFYNTTMGTSTVKVHVGWSGTDTGGTGIKSYKLQVSVNGGSYSTVSLSSATATSSTRTLTINKTYRFRVRATDKQGNVGWYAYGPTFKAVRIQNTSASAHYAGSWKTSSNSKASAGSHRYTSTAGASVTYTGSLRNIAFIATKTTTSGAAQVWIDGSLAATINLRATSTGYKRLVYHRDFGALGTHTMEIRSLGGGRVYFDAFVVLR